MPNSPASVPRVSPGRVHASHLRTRRPAEHTRRGRDGTPGTVSSRQMRRVLPSVPRGGIHVTTWRGTAGQGEGRVTAGVRPEVGRRVRSGRVAASPGPGKGGRRVRPRRPPWAPRRTPGSQAAGRRPRHGQSQRPDGSGRSRTGHISQSPAASSSSLAGADQLLCLWDPGPGRLARPKPAAALAAGCFQTRNRFETRRGPTRRGRREAACRVRRRGKASSRPSKVRSTNSGADTLAPGGSGSSGSSARTGE